MHKEFVGLKSDKLLEETLMTAIHLAPAGAQTDVLLREHDRGVATAASSLSDLPVGTGC